MFRWVSYAIFLLVLRRGGHAKSGGNLPSTKAKPSPQCLLLIVAMVFLVTPRLLHSETAPASQEKNPISDASLAWVGIADPGQMIDTWVPGDALHPLKHRRVHPREWQIAVLDDAPSEPEGLSPYSFSHRSNWLESVFSASGPDGYNSWAGPALSHWLSDAPFAPRGFAGLAPLTATPSSPGGYLAPAMDGGMPVTFGTTGSYASPTLTWQTSAVSSSVPWAGSVAAAVQSVQPATANNGVSLSSQPIFSSGKNSSWVETAVAPRASSTANLGSYIIGPSSSFASTYVSIPHIWDYNINRIYTYSSVPEINPGASIGAIDVSNAGLIFNQYVNYQVGGSIVAGAGGVVTINGLPGTPSGGDFFGGVAPVSVGGNILAAGSGARVTIATSDLTANGSVTATGGGSVYLSGTNRYVATVQDPYGIWDTLNPFYLVGFATRQVLVANGPKGVRSTSVNLSGIWPYDGKTAVSGSATRTTTITQQGSTDHFTGNLIASGTNAVGTYSAVNFGGFANPVFTSAQTLSATNGGRVGLAGLFDSSDSTANPPIRDPASNTLSLDATLTLNAGSAISALNFDRISIGGHAMQSLPVSAGSLQLGGMGDGSTLLLAPGAFGASGVGASVAVSGFQNYTATAANPLVAINGGTVRFDGVDNLTSTYDPNTDITTDTYTNNSVLTISPGAVLNVGGTGSTVQSSLSLYSYGKISIQQDLTVGSYGTLNIGTDSSVPGSPGIDISANLTADGTHAKLNVSSATGQHFAMHGNASALNGGAVTLGFGGPTNPTQSIFDGAFLIATGPNSIVSISGLATFTPSQAFNSRDGGNITIWGPPAFYFTSIPISSVSYTQAAAVAAAGLSTLTLDAWLSSADSNSSINFRYFGTIKVGTNGGLPISSNGIVTFTGLENGFNVPITADSSFTSDVALSAASGTPAGTARISIDAFKQVTFEGNLSAGAGGTIKSNATVQTTLGPVTVTADGASSTVALTTGNLFFPGDTFARNGGAVSFTGNHTTSAYLPGNFTASGANSVISVASYSSLNFQNFQTLSAWGGGDVEITGAQWGSVLANNTLTLAATLNLDTPSAMRFQWFHTINVTDAALGGLLVRGGTLDFRGDASAGASFTFGATNIGAVGVGATLTVEEFPNVRLDHNNPLFATDGGTVNIFGTYGGNTAFSINSDGQVTVGGTGSTPPSAVLINGFSNNTIGIPLSVGAYGSFTLHGMASGTTTIGSGRLFADGPSAVITLGNLGMLNFDNGVAIARNGGVINLSDFTLPGATLSLTTGGNNVGNSAVNITGSSDSYSPTYTVTLVNTIASHDTSATGPDLIFSGFSGFTLSSNVRADGGGMNFTGGYTVNDPDWGPYTANSSMTGRLDVIHGGRGVAQMVDLSNLNLTIDPSSSYTLSTNATVSGGSIVIQGNGSSKGILNISFDTNSGLYPVTLDENNLPAFSGDGIINIEAGAELTTYGNGLWNTNGLRSAYSDAAGQLQYSHLTLTGQGTASYMYPINHGIILSPTAGGMLTIKALASGNWVNDPINPLPGSFQTFTNFSDGVIRYAGNGGISFAGFTDGIDNRGLIEVLSNASLDLTNGITDHLFSSSSYGNFVANGPSVLIAAGATNTNGKKALVESQNIYAINGATIALNDFNFKNVVLSNTPINPGDTAGQAFRGGNLAPVLGTVGTGTQDVFALSTLTNTTLTGNATVLRLLGNESISLDASMGPLPGHGAALTVTNGAQFQLVGDGRHTVYGTLTNSVDLNVGSLGAGISRIQVDGGGSMLGAGNVTPNQFGLTLGNGGTLIISNPNLSTGGVNLANAPLLPSPFTFSAARAPGSASAGSNSAASLPGANANQTLTLLGDIQMAANSTLNVTIFGNSDNANSLLLAGTAGTTAASTLSGNLSVSVTFGLALTSNTLFVVFQENGAGFGTSRFANAPTPGSTITSADGNWLFGVNYVGNQVILGNATAVPEPSTYAMLAGLAAFGAGLLRHRRALRRCHRQQSFE